MLMEMIERTKSIESKFLARLTNGRWRRRYVSMITPNIGAAKVVSYFDRFEKFGSNSIKPGAGKTTQMDRHVRAILEAGGWNVDAKERLGSESDVNKWFNGKDTLGSFLQEQIGSTECEVDSVPGQRDT